MKTFGLKEQDIMSWDRLLYPIQYISWLIYWPMPVTISDYLYTRGSSFQQNRAWIRFRCILYTLDEELVNLQFTLDALRCYETIIHYSLFYLSIPFMKWWPIYSWYKEWWFGHMQICCCQQNWPHIMCKSNFRCRHRTTNPPLRHFLWRPQKCNIKAPKSI